MATMIIANDEYRRELESVAARLKTSEIDCQIRGSGAAQFIFATNVSLSIELSKAAEGIWVEFWTANNDSPDHDNFYSSYEAAATAAIEWLSG